jgi:hypothetical protein
MQINAKLPPGRGMPRQEQARRAGALRVHRREDDFCLLAISLQPCRVMTLLFLPGEDCENGP